jgi:transposase-like protein
MSKVRAPQKSLTFAEKFAIIREVEKGLNKKGDIAKKFGIPPSTLSTFKKNKDKILSENSSQKDRKSGCRACVLKCTSS